MKISKVILIVVALHVLVIGGIFVFEGCSRSRLPSSEMAEGETPASTPAPITPPVGPMADLPGLTPVAPPTGAVTPVAPVAPPAPPATAMPAPTPTVTHIVKSGDTLWKLARQHNVTVAALKKANNLSTDTLKVGQKLTIPTTAPSTTAASTTPATASAPAPASTMTTSDGTAYTVAAGDSLWKIATRNGITVDALKKANNLTSDSLKVGQKLIIPGRAAPATATATTMASSAPTVSAGIAPWSPSAVYREPGTYQENSQTIHVVDHNESPATIARKYGVRVEDLMRANGITDPRQIHYGQSLIIPSTRSGAVTPVSTVTPGLSGGN